MRNQGGIEIELQKKSAYWRICVRNSLFWLHALLSMSFLLLSLSTPFPFSSDVLAEWPLQRYIILLWLVFCVIISWVNGRKYENLLQFNTNWLASLRTWYYFRLCFSFSCVGYDLSLIKKSHTLNCYPFVQKFFIHFYKLVLGNCGSSIYC